MSNENAPHDASHRPAVGGPVERMVGRPVDKATDTEGPRGTYGCACVADSARLCTLLRYGRDIDSHEQHDDDCECLCHQWSDDNADA